MRIIWVLLGGCALGCQASAGAQASVTTQGQAQADGEGELNAADAANATPTSTKSATEFPAVTTTEAAAPAQPALLGARASLHLANASSAQCQCLAVAVGQPTDPAFRWDGEPSTIDPSSQLVIALGSEGVSCATPPANTLGASYQGYESSGVDVIVQVESAQLGRPVAGGAIIPKPSSGGRVIVRPVGNAGPYGRSADGKERDCVVWSAP